ncbi:hypothetical protein D9M68_586280 [compost metagenome]
MHGFTPSVVRHADDGTEGHGRVAGDGVLDFRRVDVLATADNHVLQPVYHIDQAFIVHIAAVAGMHPAAAQRLLRCLGLVPVAQHDIAAARHDLADLAARQLPVLGVDDPDLGAEAGLARGAHLAVGIGLVRVVFRPEHRAHRREFGHAIALGELDRRKDLLGASEQRLGDW